MTRNAMPSFPVRAARSDDLDAVLALLDAAGLPAEGVGEHFADFCVAEGDGVVVGAAGLEVYGPFALLRSVVVAPELRDRRVGAALVGHLLGRADRDGIREIYLLTTTAERYFPRFGFRPVARDDVPAPVQTSVEFREACPASAAVLCRTAGAPASGPTRPEATRS